MREKHKMGFYVEYKPGEKVFSILYQEDVMVESIQFNYNSKGESTITYLVFLPSRDGIIPIHEGGLAPLSEKYYFERKMVMPFRIFGRGY